MILDLETSKRIKDLGFKGQSFYYYNKEGHLKGYGYKLGFDSSVYVDMECIAPHVFDVLKFIREKFKINIIVYTSLNKWFFIVEKIGLIDYFKHQSDVYYDNYNEALLGAIKNIIYAKESK